eukprot:6204650-Pleurochrysis_carterae.AAC.1
MRKPACAARGLKRRSVHVSCEGEGMPNGGIAQTWCSARTTSEHRLWRPTPSPHVVTHPQALGAAAASSVAAVGARKSWR